MAYVPSTSPEPRRILIRGVNWLGDAVMTTPALARLRQKFPKAHISLLTAAKLAPLWQAHPDLDEILTFAAGEGLWPVGRRLRNGQFDLALVLPNSPRSAIECWLGRIPARVGYARSWRNYFLTSPVGSPPGYRAMRKRSANEIRALIDRGPAEPEVSIPAAAFDYSSHQIHHYLHLAAAVGANPVPLPPRLVVDPAEIAAAAHKFALAPMAGTAEGRGNASVPVLLGLNPGAEYGPAKRWPADFFIQAARAVSQAGNFQWLIFGGPSDTAVASRITAGIQADGVPGGDRAINLAGRTSLRELMALLTLCRVLLTNDTGPMHIAAALGTPVVVPFGSTSPELTGPGLPGDATHRLLTSTVPCSPCFLRTCPIDLRCMASLSPQLIAEAVLLANG